MDVLRNAPEQAEPDPERPSANLRWPHFAAIVAGAGLALLVSGGGSAALWGKTLGMFSAPRNSHVSAAFFDPELDRQRPQQQAEILLERAVSGPDEGTDQKAQVEAQIEARIDTWRGQLQWDSQLGDLTTVALNSTDQNVRASAIEVQLAAYGLTKSQSSVDTLVRQADSRDHAQKTWALWTLGLLGNRGVETDRVVRVLTAHLKDSGNDADEDVRRSAVEGLALVGTTSTIAPLLDAMRDDPSLIVRERAACSLAQSGMLSHGQRLIAVPQLINYSGDPTLDPQTRAWAFQALADITKQRLPNDSAAWRAWYENNRGN
jgi:HEAT repeat protein